jgi:hypothetical protein
LRPDFLIRANMGASFEGHPHITQIIFYCQALFVTTVALRL